MGIFGKENNLTKGKNLLNRGKYNEAIIALNDALKSDPNNAEAHMGLCKAFLGVGNYDLAISSAKQVVRLVPNNAKAHNSLGASYVEKGYSIKDISHIEDGIKEYNEAIKLDPNYNLAIINLQKAQSILEEMRRTVTAQSTQASIIYKEKEIIREIVKIPCEYCGTLIENTMVKCPSCGAPQTR